LILSVTKCNFPTVMSLLFHVAERSFRDSGIDRSAESLFSPSSFAHLVSVSPFALHHHLPHFVFRCIQLALTTNSIQFPFLPDEGNYTVIRDCALDSGSLTTDTELVRMSHCGGFYLGKRYISGCVMSCHEDACNSTTNPQSALIAASIACCCIVLVSLFIQKML
jgi:hypothetical protein